MVGGLTQGEPASSRTTDLQDYTSKSVELISGHSTR